MSILKEIMHMLQRIILIFLMVILLGVSVTGLTPIHAQGGSPNLSTIDAARNHEAITVFIERCAGGRMPGTHAQREVEIHTAGINNERMMSGQIFQIYGNAYQGQHSVRMSHLFGANVDNRRCESEYIVGRAIRALYGSNRAFAEKFFRYDGDNGQWYRQDEWTDKNALLSELRRDAVAAGYYVVKDGGQYPTDAMALRYQVFRPIFEACMEPQGSTSVTGLNTITAPDGTVYRVKVGEEETRHRLGLVFGGTLTGSGFAANTSGSSRPTADYQCNTIANIMGPRATTYYREIFQTPEERGIDTVDLDSSGQDDTEPTCENKGGPFGWILCFVVDLIMDTLDVYADWISNRLEFDLDENQGKGQFKEAWSVMRNIANIMFVMAFLIIIISQTLTGRF